MDDVRELADVAVERNTAIDFHINEAPMVEQDHFEHYDTRVHQAAPLTRNYILGFCYNTRRVVWWGTKQALRGFKGVSGSF